MPKSGGRKGRPQGCSLCSHRLRRLKPLTPTLSPATHSAMRSMLPCCTSDLNRRFYVDVFARFCRERMGSGQPGFDVFVEPGNVTTRGVHLGGGTTGVAPERMPQMPAFHLVEPGYRGITLINIGTGPSNARTITDHVAVLR